MNKQGGPKLATVVGVALLAGSLGIYLMSQGPESARAAAQNKATTEAILKIAEAIKKGDMDSAKKQAAALAKKVDDVEDVMAVFKPRKKDGLGVGKVPGAIVPDGIEQMLITVSRDAPTPATMAKQAEALEDMSYVIAAVAEVINVKLPPTFNAKQTKKDWLAWSAETRTGADALAKAAKAKGAQDVHSAAKKLTAACNSCHSVFK